MRRALTLVLALSLLLALPAAAFSDVSGDAWYAQAVDYVQRKGFMNGVGGDSFAPEDTVTRGMLAAVLHRTAGSPFINVGLTFEDVLAGSWYGDSVLWCVGMGIVTGVDSTHFLPDDPVTREQVALMLWRRAGWPYPGQNAYFTDGQQINFWSQGGVDWAVRAGVVNGKPDGSFDPQGYATRAEVAQMLMKYDRWQLSQGG